MKSTGYGKSPKKPSFSTCEIEKMVQIKDSVLRDSGFRKTFPPSFDSVLASMRCAVRRSGRMRHPDAMPRKTPAPRFRCGISTADVNNLSTTCQECLYVVDFRRVVRLPKKVRIFRETGLTFRKVGHVSRNSGTIQSASSKPGEIRGRVQTAEAFLRLLFAGCVVRSGQGVPTAPARGFRGNVNKFRRSNLKRSDVNDKR